MKLRKFNDEVYYADAPIVRLGDDDIALVRQSAAGSPRRRARICAHQSPADPLHEMLIVLRREGYVRPHKHLRRCESFHVFTGRADVVLFDDAGRIEDVIHVGDACGDARMYRLNVPRFHTVLVRSDDFVVHETTLGPFDPSDTIQAPWAPADGDIPRIAPYLQRLEAELAARSADTQIAVKGS